MENEEKRELPEGVKEEMGACIFCGQTYKIGRAHV